MSAHIVYCRGCKRAWWDIGPLPSCTCTCTDESDALYEAWVVDPEFDFPVGAWWDSSFAQEAQFICLPDESGGIDERPDCPVHGENAPYDAEASDIGEAPF